MMAGTTCETCANFVYDELADCYFCSINLDEDEMRHFLSGTTSNCAYWRNGDDYAVVKKQK